MVVRLKAECGLWLPALFLLAAVGCSNGEATKTGGAAAQPGSVSLKEAQLSDITGLVEKNKGKVVLLNFWGLS
jgi:hypothetical protein